MELTEDELSTVVVALWLLIEHHKRYIDETTLLYKSEVENAKNIIEKIFTAEDER